LSIWLSFFQSIGLFQSKVDRPTVGIFLESLHRLHILTVIKKPPEGGFSVFNKNY
jgi:hypothetical protein